MMHCPNCHHEQTAKNAECERCGVIFSKYYSAHNPQTKDVNDSQTPSISIGHLFFCTKSENTRLYFYGRLLIFIIIIVWGVKFMASPIHNSYAGKSFMHLVNLPFHEAGHIFFRPFGSFMASLGGTMGQLLMPLICFFVLLLKTRDTFGSSVTLWWFGQNMFDIAPYINDARSLSLPLLGGNYGHSSPYGFHDWQYLLTESGLLKYDHFIASSCITIGVIIFMMSFVWGGILLIKQYKTLS